MPSPTISEAESPTPSPTATPTPTATPHAKIFPDPEKAAYPDTQEMQAETEGF